MSSLQDVVVIGSASWNQIVSVDELPEARPHTVTAREAWHALGGTSAGKALHLAQQGVETLCVAAIGDDADAGAIRERLRGPGLYTSFVECTGPSEHHLNLVTPRGERVSVFLHHAPQPVPGRWRSEALAAARSARVVVADLMPIARSLLGDLSAQGAWIWTDLHDYDGTDAYHDDFVDAADVVIMNDDGTRDVRGVMTALLARGVSVVVCTRGAQGAVAMTTDGDTISVEAFPASVVDTNGAGDAFAAGMIAEVLREDLAPGALRGESLRAAMLAGAARAVKALETRDLAPDDGSSR
ncbi:carbohydrate kinase family protein [Demequina sp. NBRC 110052]|uniref:carbohydrate kinase family protein n=1 Tax=Demequina sp. NBRC 110052 TaxID=1570341 RepID=UPI000A067D73|nr:carbohydrate kinase family protein [Demequina sp. NBRC 110052]